MPENKNLSRPPTNGRAYWISSRPDDCGHDQCVEIRQRVTFAGGRTDTVAVHMHLDGNEPVPLSPTDLVRYAMQAISGEIHQRERVLHLDDECGCAEKYGFEPHTNREHERQSCGLSHTMNGPELPCGGCYDCMIAQAEHYKEKDHADAATE